MKRPVTDAEHTAAERTVTDEEPGLLNEVRGVTKTLHEMKLQARGLIAIGLIHGEGADMLRAIRDWAQHLERDAEAAILEKVGH